MKNLIILLLLGFFITNIGYAQTTTLMCGGKYIGYDDEFIYLNWNKDKKIFILLSLWKRKNCLLV